MEAPILIVSALGADFTPLRLRLDAHPAVCSPPEFSLGWLCNTLHTAVLGTLGHSHEHPGARRAFCLAYTRQMVAGLLDTYCERRGKRRWCVGSRRNIDFREILRAVFPDAVYLCLHRHPFDAARSLGENDRDAITAFLERWCSETEQLLSFEAANHERALRVIQEQLAADPDEVFRSILSFVGAEWSPSVAESAVDAAIDPDRDGAAWRVSFADVPEHLEPRVHALLDALGYPAHGDCSIPVRAHPVGSR